MSKIFSFFLFSFFFLVSSSAFAGMTPAEAKFKEASILQFCGAGFKHAEVGIAPPGDRMEQLKAASLEAVNLLIKSGASLASLKMSESLVDADGSLMIMACSKELAVVKAAPTAAVALPSF
jgi:hypothetical protein